MESGITVVERPSLKLSHHFHRQLSTCFPFTSLACPLKFFIEIYTLYLFYIVSQSVL